MELLNFDTRRSDLKLKLSEQFDRLLATVGEFDGFVILTQNKDSESLKMFASGLSDLEIVGLLEMSKINFLLER